MVNIGTLFPVHLYAYKVTIHYFRYLLIFKTLLFHHMAPVAGRITNTDQYGPVFALQLFQVPPRPTRTSPPDYTDAAKDKDLFVPQMIWLICTLHGYPFEYFISKYLFP
jgi:hypothetical protein